MTRTADQIRHSARGPRPIPLGSGVPQRDADTPSFLDTTVTNGLRVLLVRQPAMPTIQLRLTVPFAGSHPLHSARVRLLTHTLFAGTTRRDRHAIDMDAARVGSRPKATATSERLTIAATSVASGLATLLDIILDAITDATYPDTELLRARQTVTQRLTMDRADQRLISWEALDRRRYGDHPIARELPHPADVVTIEPDEVRDLHRLATVPQGAILLLVGDLDVGQALTEVERATAAWTSSITAQRLPPLPEITGSGLHVIHHPGAAQSHLRLSAQAVTHTHTRYPALHLANTALGGGFAARLIETIREQEGLCYAANSNLGFTQTVRGTNATVNVLMNTATEKTAAAVTALRRELERIAAQPPDDRELSRTLHYLLGSHLIGRMSQRRLADTLIVQLNYGLDVDWLATERELLSDTTVENVAAAAQEFLDPTRFVGVIVGDAEKLATSLSEADGVSL